jgi:methyltransferase (TIGR00027 family)
MNQPKRSHMAERVAISRAAHQLMDEQPLVFTDPLALAVLGEAAQRAMRETLAAQHTEGLRRTRGVVAVRSRFAEDELLEAVNGGTTQYVILGAGLDTFAYRRTDLAERLTIYEVDQPATQAWKQERLAEARIAVPANVRFVALDFNRQSLAEGLAAAGFQRHESAFFAWLGVSYYLARASIIATLRFIGSQKARSQVVFDFAVAEAALPARHRHLLRSFLTYMQNTDEPWQTWFTPAELKNELREAGFTDIVHLDAEKITARYLAGRHDELLAGPLVGLISAKK